MFPPQSNTPLRSFDPLSLPCLSPSNRSLKLNGLSEGTLTWGNLIDPDQAALALSQYKAGNYSSSQWTYVNEATGYVSLADINPDYLSYSQVASSALDQNVQAITSWQFVQSSSFVLRWFHKG